MNEPSNFIWGSTSGCPQNNLNNPPYTPAILDRSLPAKTVCASARQEAGYHYDVHNLYGHTEGISSNHALSAMKPGERPFIISRSTFMGSGRYVGHWTGDNNADWDNLKYSIAATLNSNIFGITFTGKPSVKISERRSILSLSNFQLHIKLNCIIACAYNLL